MGVYWHPRTNDDFDFNTGYEVLPPEIEIMFVQWRLFIFKSYHKPIDFCGARMTHGSCLRKYSPIP